MAGGQVADHPGHRQAALRRDNVSQHVRLVGRLRRGIQGDRLQALAAQVIDLRGETMGTTWSVRYAARGAAAPNAVRDAIVQFTPEEIEQLPMHEVAIKIRQSIQKIDKHSVYESLLCLNSLRLDHGIRVFEDVG